MHEKNRIAEQYLTTKAIIQDSLLIDSSLSVKLRAEVIVIANYLHNEWPIKCNSLAFIPEKA